MRSPPLSSYEDPHEATRKSGPAEVAGSEPLSTSIGNAEFCFPSLLVKPLSVGATPHHSRLQTEDKDTIDQIKDRL